jgi:hypothetical protein
MSKTYVRPIEAELPAALAKEMGWKLRYWDSTEDLSYDTTIEDACEGAYFTGPDELDFIKCPASHKTLHWSAANNDDVVYNPLEDRNHSGMAVALCIELGLLREYVCNLWLVKQGPRTPFLSTYVSCNLLAFSSALDESFAAHRTLWEHNKDKP